MNIIYSAVSFLIGSATTVQSGMNGQMKLATGNTVFASFTNFIVGTAALAAVLVFVAVRGIYRLPTAPMLRETKWWMWMGGPIGVLYIMSLVVMPLLIGYASFFSMLVAGQLISSVAADHTGWLGIPVQRIDKTRLLGVVLLFAGAVIIQHT